MATTYKVIATVTVGSGGASSIDFTNIPQNYTDLIVKYSIRSTIGSTDAQVIINSNTNSVYSHIFLRSNPAVSIASGSGTQGNDPIYVNWSSTTASSFGNGEIYIANYGGSNKKSIGHDVVTENNASDAWMKIQSTLFDSTSAITSIKLEQSGGSFVQYSTATLYGISSTV